MTTQQQQREPEPNEKQETYFLQDDSGMGWMLQSKESIHQHIDALLAEMEPGDEENIQIRYQPLTQKEIDELPDI